MKTLRPCQADFFKEIQYAAAKHQKIIAQAVTGFGKSVVIGEIAKAAINKGKTVLLLTESTKIFPQLSEEVGNCLEISAGVKNVPLTTGTIIVSMAQTLARRPVFLSWFAGLGKNLIVIADEAHIGSMNNVLSKLPDPFLIGFTATPDFRVAKHLPEFYNEIVCSLQPSELVDLGFLSSYSHKARTRADLANLKKQGGEFTEQSQQEAFEKPQVYEGLVEDLGSVGYKKAMVFTASIAHAENVSASLTASGFTNVVVHSQSDPSLLDKFQKGDVDICVSVAMLTKGYDFKKIDLIILLRATTSLALYLQMCGRGSRIIDGKDGFLVLDYGDNWKRHGLWIHDRDWEVLWKGKPKKDDGVAPIKDCPACGFILAVSIMLCPSCGHVFEKKIDGPIGKTELINLTEEYNKLKGRKISTLSPLELVAYVKTTNKKPYGLRIAKAKLQAGDHEFLKEYAKAMKYHHNFYARMAEELVYSDSEIIEFHDIEIR